MKTLNINIPFQGFYYSIYDQAVDQEFDQTVDGIVEDTGLDPSDVGDALRKHAAFPRVYWDISKAYVDAVNAVLLDEVGINAGLVFVEMISPKEYNFETNRIFGNIAMAALKELLKACDKKDLDALIHERFTSRSGFISFYPNSLETWLKKPIGQWDHNQLGTVLLCVLNRVEDWENAVFDEVQRGDTFCKAFDGCVNWTAFEAGIEAIKSEVKP